MPDGFVSTTVAAGGFQYRSDIFMRILNSKMFNNQTA